MSYAKGQVLLFYDLQTFVDWLVLAPEHVSFIYKPTRMGIIHIEVVGQ